MGGDVFTGPKFAIDAIAAGKEGAESLHRYVQHGHMTIGRNRRDFIELDKSEIVVESYDNSSRQVEAKSEGTAPFREYQQTRKLPDVWAAALPLWTRTSASVAVCVLPSVVSMPFICTGLCLNAALW